MQMRKYQEAAINSVLDAPTKNNLVVLPTGGGKTPMVMELARRRQKRTLMIAHRDELIHQAAETAERIWEDASVGIVKGKSNEHYCDIVIASIQSLHRRLSKIDPNRFGTIITDEAHHSAALSYKKTYRHFGVLENSQQKAIHVGITATPNRSDGKLLGEIYDKVAYEITLLDLIPEYLCDIRVIERNSGISIGGVKMSAGDFNCKQLGEILNTEYGNNFVIDFYKSHAEYKGRTIAFCADIAHSVGLAEAFQQRGFPCAVISSLTPLEERRDVLKKFRSGEIKIITNCGILTEGFDCPELECIILARPTKSELLMMQQIGRVTRRSEGKSEGLVLNIACTGKLSIVSPAKLFDLAALNEKKTLTELVKETKEQREKKEKEEKEERVIPVDELADEIDNIFDTRTADRYSKLGLGWINNPWHGWSLNFGGMGIVHISAQSKADIFRVTHFVKVPAMVSATPQKKNPKQLQSSDIARYGKQTSIFTAGAIENTKSIMQTRNKIVAQDINGLEKAFEIAENYIEKTKILAKNRWIVSKDARWRNENASMKQMRFLRALARQESKKWSSYIKSKKGKLKKAEASAAIAFLTMLRDQKRSKG